MAALIAFGSLKLARSAAPISRISPEISESNPPKSDSLPQHFQISAIFSRILTLCAQYRRQNKPAVRGMDCNHLLRTWPCRSTAEDP
jgi:hypothetical protein